MTGSSTSFSRGTSSGSRTKTGNLQGTDFTDPGKEREKEGRKEKEIKKSQFPVKGSSSELYGKCCPFLCKIPQDVLLIWQSSVNYICTQLNFLRQSNLRIASFVNHSFSSAALHPSTFPIPSSFPRLCSLRWARFPKGVIAALPGETHSRHSRRLTSLKPAKMTNSWRRKGTHTEMLQLSHLLILEEIGVVWRQVLSQPPCIFRRPWRWTPGWECYCLNSLESPLSFRAPQSSSFWVHDRKTCPTTPGPRGKHRSPAHPQRWYVLALATSRVPGLCFLHLK